MIIQGNRNLKYRTLRVDICDNSMFNENWKDLVSKILPDFLNKTKIRTIPMIYDEHCYNHPNFLDICNSMNFISYSIRSDSGIIDKNIVKEIKYHPRHIILETNLDKLGDCWDFYEQTKYKIYIALTPDLSDIKSTIKMFNVFKERKEKGKFSGDIYLSIDYRTKRIDEYDELKRLLTPKQKIYILDKETNRIDLLQQNFNICLKNFKCDIAKYFIRMGLDNSFLKCPNSKEHVEEDKIIECKNILCKEPECSFYLLEYGRKEDMKCSLKK